MPPELTVLAKTLLNLDRVGHALAPEFDPNAALRRHAQGLVSARLRREAAPGKLLTTLLDAKDFAQALPERANRILELIAENRLKVDVDAIDEAKLERSLARVGNRISAGLVLAALIVGAAMLADADTPFQILGYPGIAFILFIVAVLGGFWLLAAIVREGL